MFLPPGYKVSFGLPMRGLGSLGMSAAQSAATERLIAAAGSNCETLATHADTYNRLSNNTGKSKDTRAAAAEISAIFQQKYLECMSARGVSAAAPTYTAPTSTPVAAPTIGTVLNKVATALIPSLAPTTAPVGQAAPVEEPKSNMGLYVAGGIGLLAVAGIAWYLLRKRGGPQ